MFLVRLLRDGLHRRHSRSFASAVGGVLGPRDVVIRDLLSLRTLLLPVAPDVTSRVLRHQPWTPGVSLRVGLLRAPLSLRSLRDGFAPSISLTHTRTGHEAGTSRCRRRPGSAPIASERPARDEPCHAARQFAPVAPLGPDGSEPGRSSLRSGRVSLSLPFPAAGGGASGEGETPPSLPRETALGGGGLMGRARLKP